MFSQVVEFYRALGMPPIQDGGFSYSGIVAPAVISLLNDMVSLPNHFGVFATKTIEGDSVDIEFSLPGTEHGRFHSTLSEFIRVSPSLERGLLPDQYYICDLNFYSHDSFLPKQVENLVDCCEFIRLLSVLASDVSPVVNVSTNNNLVFILAADGKSPSRTFTLRTRIDNEILDVSIPHLNFLRALLSNERENQIHIEERRMIMQMAIAEILALTEEGDNMFTYLVRNWREVIRKYRHNFQAFLHQYSFEKVRKEIASAEIEHATKLSGVLGDIAGKLLALPVSLGGILLLRNAKGLEEFLVLALGLVIVSVIFVGVLLNQWLQVDRLRNSFDIIFGQYDDKLDEFPKKLRNPIIRARGKIKRQGRALSCTFIVFSVLALLPLFGTIYIGLDRYNAEFIKVWKVFLSCIHK